MRRTIMCGFFAVGFALGGCVASTRVDSEPAEDVDVAEGELTQTGRPFVGNWFWNPGTVAFGEYESLGLRADGQYAASVRSSLVDPELVCERLPCTAPEHGRWSARRSQSGIVRITLMPEHGARRIYMASIDPLVRALSLSRFGQPSSVLQPAYE